MTGFLRFISALFLTLLYEAWPAQARTASDFFAEAPLSVAEGLSPTVRLDMIDYFALGSSVRSDNNFGAKVGLRSVAEDMIVWQDEDSTFTTLAVIPNVLPNGKTNRAVAPSDTILMVITVLNKPFTDSVVRYFDKNWSQFQSRSFPEAPDLKTWMQDSGKRQLKAAAQAIPFIVTEASYDPSSRTLTFTNRTASLFVESEHPDELQLMRPSLKYIWNSGFKLVK